MSDHWQWSDSSGQRGPGELRMAVVLASAEMLYVLAERREGVCGYGRGD